MPINLFDLAAAPAPAAAAQRPRRSARQADDAGPVSADRQETGGSAGIRRQAQNSDDNTRTAAPPRHRRADAPAKAQGAQPLKTTNAPPTADGAQPDGDGDNPFVAMIRQATAILNKAVKAANTADQTAQTPGVDAQTAMALLAQMAQFAHMMPGLAQSAGNLAGQDPALAQGLAGVASAADGGLQLDPQLLQALFGQSSAGGTDASASLGVTAPGHIPLGQPLPPEMLAELQDLRDQMGRLQRQLATLLKEHGGPAVKLPATDASASLSDAQGSSPTAADPAGAVPIETAPVPVPQAPIPVPPAPVDPAASAKSETAPASKQATTVDPAKAGKTAAAPVKTPAAAQRQAAVDMLLKPMRGELSVEKGGDYVLKDLQTDVAYQPESGVDLLQNLVEQGKQVASHLEGDKDLADALGIRLAGDKGHTDVPVAQTEAGNLLLDALTDEAVAAVGADDDVSDRTGETPADSAEAPHLRADEALTGTFHLSQADGSTAVASSDGPRAQQAVMQQVIDKVKELAPGPAQVRMVLNPESLGQVTIRLVAHQGDVSVRIITDNPDAHRLLDGGMDHLKAALADSGIKLDQATVVNLAAQPDQRQDNTPQHRQQQPQSEAQGREPQPEATPEELAALEELTALLQGRPVEA